MFCDFASCLAPSFATIKLNQCDTHWLLCKEHLLYIERAMDYNANPPCSCGINMDEHHLLTRTERETCNPTKLSLAEGQETS